MVDFNELLSTLYEIQGLADPSQPLENAAQRLAEIYELACQKIKASGWHPEDDTKKTAKANEKARLLRIIEGAKDVERSYAFLMYSLPWDDEYAVIEEIRKEIQTLNYVHGGSGELKITF